MTIPEDKMPPLPIAFFDEFGKGADDRVQDYARSAIAAFMAQGGEPLFWINDEDLRRHQSGEPVSLDSMPHQGMVNGGKPKGSKFYNTPVYAALHCSADKAPSRVTDENGRHVRVRVDELEKGRTHAKYLLALLNQTDWAEHDRGRANNEWQAATTCEHISNVAKAALAATHAEVVVQPDGWISFADQRPPETSALDDPNVSTPDRVLVTNNIEARDRMGRMSHVWFAMPIESSEGWVAYDEGDRQIQGLTHWRVAETS